MASFRWRRAVVGARVEGTEGTAVDLSAGYCKIKAENVSLSYDLPFYPREAVSASFSSWTGTSGGPRTARLTFDVAMATSGTAATAPTWGDLMEACYFSETIAATTVYAPASAPSAPTGSSFTTGLYIDGLYFKFHGCRGNCKMRLNSGEVGMLNFEIYGVYNIPTDTSLPTVTSYESTVPAAIVSGAFTLDSQAFKFKSLEIDMGNKLAPRHDPSQSTGVFSYAFTGRDVTGTIDPEYELVATYDFFTKLTTNSEAALSLTIGSGAGTTLTIAAPQVQWTAIQPGDRDGLLVANANFRLNRNSDGGNDELTITQS
jgi:hypothetical protein